MRLGEEGRQRKRRRWRRRKERNRRRKQGRKRGNMWEPQESSAAVAPPLLPSPSPFPSPSPIPPLLWYPQRQSDREVWEEGREGGREGDMGQPHEGHGGGRRGKERQPMSCGLERGREGGKRIVSVDFGERRSVYA